MKIYNSLEEYEPRGRARVALGYFDGVHAGHRAVIGSALCGGAGERTVVLTFRESPAAALGLPIPPALTDNARKAALLAQTGADAVIFADFGAIRGLTPEAFVREVLCERLSVASVSCGYNYRFGRGGAGDTAALRELCAARGIGVTVVPPVSVDGEAVSSTRIRALLAEGEIERANRMLVSPFAVSGTIRSGNHIGTALGFPTMNLPVGEGLCLPRRGVYASRVTVGGRAYSGATNIGVRPTVEEHGEPVCETFLIGYEGGDLYGCEAVCELTRFLRPEQRFESFDALQKQVMSDIAAVEKNPV